MMTYTSELTIHFYFIKQKLRHLLFSFLGDCPFKNVHRILHVQSHLPK